MSDKQMSLEQVRDEMRSWRSHTGFESGRLLGWADAIDAEIRARGEPVAWETFVHGEWEPTRDPEFHRKENRAVRALYTAPPAPKIEVTIPVAKRAIEARNAYLQEHPGDAVDAMVRALKAALKETP